MIFNYRHVIMTTVKLLAATQPRYALTGLSTKYHVQNIAERLIHKMRYLHHQVSRLLPEVKSRQDDNGRKNYRKSR